MKPCICAVVIIGCVLAARVAAHGGTLHETGPEQNNYARVKVASCSKWVPASGRLVAGQVQPAADRRAPVDVQGSVTLFQYLYKNCTYEGQDPSAGAVFNVTVSREGKPLSGVTFNGLGMTGSCAANGVAAFYFNPDKEPAFTKDNLLWFSNHTTKADGKIVGNGANDGLIRTVAQGGKEPVKSMMLMDNKTNAILSCCDIVPAGPATTNWTKALDGKGKPCEDEHHSAGKATEKNATMVDNHSGHNLTDGHDHSGHNHTDHNSTATGPAGGSKARSAAGVATLDMVTALAAAAAAAALCVL